MTDKTVLPETDIVTWLNVWAARLTGVKVTGTEGLSPTTLASKMRQAASLLDRSRTEIQSAFVDMQTANDMLKAENERLASLHPEATLTQGDLLGIKQDAYDAWDGPGCGVAKSHGAAVDGFNDGFKAGWNRAEEHFYNKTVQALRPDDATIERYSNAYFNARQMHHKDCTDPYQCIFAGRAGTPEGERGCDWWIMQATLEAVNG